MTAGRTFTLLLLCLAAGAAEGAIYGAGDDVVDLDVSTFSSSVLGGDGGKGEFWVVEWYANWCGGIKQCCNIFVCACVWNICVIYKTVMCCS